MQYDLRGKTALVTGGSRGLGAAISSSLANNGAKVAINYLSRRDEAKAVQSNIIGNGGTAELFPGDVTDENDVIQICKGVTNKFGPIDILVVNATLVHIHKPIEELVWQDMLDHLEFFVKSPLLLVQQVLPAMKMRRSGRIINIGSEVFEQGLSGFCNYVAANGAQLGLTRSWANELGRFQITVNLVAPGWIPTEMHRDDPEEMKAEYARKVPLGRMGDAKDIGEVVSFLASDGGRFITGQRISVNGGNTMV
jgi:3-oxoacyl-[acyl-carrier protein] reductase